MRELTESVTSDSPSSEFFSAIQLYAIDEPLLPNLKTLRLVKIKGWFIPFIPLFLSQRTTSVTLGFGPSLQPEATRMIASVITTLPTLCLDLQTICLYCLPSGSIITAIVSNMLLNTNRNTLQRFCVESSLTVDASKVLYKLPNLRDLSVDIEGGTSLPPASLPNLTDLTITSDNEDNWPQIFHGATFGKLESVTFYPQFEEVDDFLEVFEMAALSSSIQNTLSKFHIYTPYPWDPNYYSLLPFTQMVELDIEFLCEDGCSSTVDDEIINNLSRAMPKLESLVLCDATCDQIITGVTTKGLLALAHHCPKLSTLCVHIQVASLCEPLGIPGMVPTAGPAASWTDCALTDLAVGEARVPEGSAMIIALTLLRIFPRLRSIEFADEAEGWEEVGKAINCSREIIDCSSKQRPFITP